MNIEGKTKKRQLFIEATSLAGDISGVGHNTLELIKAISDDKSITERYELNLLMPFDKLSDLKDKGLSNVKVRKIPVPLIAFNVLWKMNLLPPLDLLFGKGIYIFPNYRNFPLIFSKNITFIHDVTFKIFPEFVQPKNLKFLSSNINRWIKRADLIATLSASSKKGLVDYLHVPEKKIIVVPCGVDTNLFFPRSEKEIGETLESLSVDGKYLVYVGNIEPRKNVIGILNAYERAFKKFPGLGLLIVGADGWLNQEVEKKIDYLKDHKYKIIRPQRYIEDSELPSIYSGAAALVYPTYYEGFGLPPLQAMACGTPVIVSHNSSIPEVVKDAGIYIDPNSDKSIEEAIYEIMRTKKTKDYERRLALGLSIAKEFSWGQSASLLIKAVDSLK